jgi:hypothetical protein
MLKSRLRADLWDKANPERRRERFRKSAAKLQKIPGTWAYNALHGIGLPGERARYHCRKNYRKQANERDLQTLKEMLNGTT